MIKDSSIIQQKTPDHYVQLVEDCKAIIVECEFTSRWALVEGYHLLGQRISEDEDVSLTQLAKDINKSLRTVQRAVQFFKKYPDLNLLPEGKNTSWTQISNKYLPVSQPGKVKCNVCGGNLETACHETK